MDNCIGQKIKEIRLMTEQEHNAEGWDEPTTVIVLENEQQIYPSSDDEGNGPGTLFGINPNGVQEYIIGDKLK